jgi:hypothetical protein
MSGKSIKAQGRINPLATVIREAAGKATDPDEVESLLRSAEKVDKADEAMQQAHEDLLVEIESSKVLVGTLRRRDHLPRWGVVFVLLSLLGFLVFIALKHHV